MLKQWMLFSLVFGLYLLNISVAQAQKLIPAQPELAAKAWVLVDAQTGRVLAEKNADEQAAAGKFSQDDDHLYSLQ